MIVMPAASIFARVGARDVDVLERHVLHAHLLGHVERLIERELAHRIRRQAQLQWSAFTRRRRRGAGHPAEQRPGCRCRKPTEKLSSRRGHQSLL
jgi:uncharacterized protein (DUF2342 family)